MKKLNKRPSSMRNEMTINTCLCDRCGNPTCSCGSCSCGLDWKMDVDLGDVARNSNRTAPERSMRDFMIIQGK